jgi:hypothetical protein
MNEIENSVSPRIHARDQIGPSYRALWRRARLQIEEAAAGGERGKVRHFPFFHVLPQQFRIQAVDAQDQ